ncbi:hypothetical protein T01_5464 [Trichinella spiralis]|uniref:Uncharacterized protein n=1 Tax=Trichinella spiralis TaxID=6334 RepID=A0A0V1AYW2_TRISP|nr:hypothetical protein T01_5464 [Trichinella spiralis]
MHLYLSARLVLNTMEMVQKLGHFHSEQFTITAVDIAAICWCNFLLNRASRGNGKMATHYFFVTLNLPKQCKRNCIFNCMTMRTLHPFDLSLQKRGIKQSLKTHISCILSALQSKKNDRVERESFFTTGMYETNSNSNSLQIALTCAGAIAIQGILELNIPFIGVLSAFRISRSLVTTMLKIEISLLAVGDCSKLK